MNKSLFSLFILSCLVYNISLGQDRQEVALGKYIITDAKMNGVDVTQEILEAEAFTVFYMYENEEGLHMANVWPKKNSQSYGSVSSFSIEYKKDTYEGYKADYYSFDWHYTNDYDQKTGIAKVSVIEVFETQGVVLIMKMITDDSDEIEYVGYMEGELDFSTFE
ncbi:hypothetical protein [Lutimonas vermicola]|uniref:DUF4251 domain-containing protein n=1 Tax=Lutimonas vermicola TaxID=414288 RepID=A0ABU9L2Q7_9FLAO